jgi:hypothetical protein
MPDTKQDEQWEAWQHQMDADGLSEAGRFPRTIGLHDPDAPRPFRPWRAASVLFVVLVTLGLVWAGALLLGWELPIRWAQP